MLDLSRPDRNASAVLAIVTSLLAATIPGCQDVIQPGPVVDTPTSTFQSISADIANTDPTVTAVSGPIDPVAVNTTVLVTATFADADAADIHTAMIHWGDGASSVASVAEAEGSGTASASHTYKTAGIYTVEIVVEDDNGGTASSRYEYITVYNPDGEWVAGSGAIESPVDACTWTGCNADGSTVGGATFGFSSSYARGAATPSGNTRFRFRAGDLRFASTAYEWLVVGGARAKYKGSGEINGDGEYGFLLTAVDGDVQGGGGVDLFRIKIWDKATSTVVYDNQRGDDDDAGPTTALTRGKIRIQRSGQNTAPAVTITSPADGTTFVESSEITFSANATDLEDGDVSASVAWSSGLDGSLGAGATVTAVLTPGSHTITATATDGNGLTDASIITVIVNAPPVVTITSPASATHVNEGAAVSFEATASDPEDGDLSAEVVWTSDVDGEIGTGGSFTRSDLSVGVHTIDATVGDSRGAPGSASHTLTIDNVAPVVVITAPADGAEFDPGAQVDFTAVATDASDDISEAVQWASSLDGSLGAGASQSTAALSSGIHTITASVADPDDAAVISSTTITVTVKAAGVEVTQGEELTSEMGSLDAIDRYVYEGTVGEVVQVSVHAADGSDLQGVVTVLDPDDAAIGTLTFGSKPASLTADIEQTGTYVLEVAATANAPGSYVLTVTSGLSEITLHSNTEGTLGGQDETDQFTFAATAGTLVNVAYGSPDLEGRVSIAIYDPAGTLLISKRSEFVLYGGRYTETGIIALPADGIYSIHLRAVDLGSYGNYTLGLAEIDPVPMPITTAAPYVDTPGDITILGERHFYSFSGNTADVINVAITTAASLDAGLILRAASGDPFYSRTSLGGTRTANWWGGEDPHHAEIGRRALPADGEYIVEVNSLGTVPLSTKFGSYTLRIFDIVPTPVALDTEISGSIDPYFDLDGYSFEALSSPAVLIHTEHSLSGGGYLYTYLYDDPTAWPLSDARSSLSYAPKAYHEIALVPGTGTYTIEQDGTGFTLGDYRVFIVSIEAPTALDPGNPAHTGEIDTPGERDYYEFAAGEGQTVTITVAVPSSSALTAVFRVYSIEADGHFTRPGTMVFQDFFLSIGPGHTVTRSITLPATGTYIIEVDGTGGDTAGPAAGPYEVRVGF